jgi:hypothetical protein
MKCEYCFNEWPEDIVYDYITLIDNDLNDFYLCCICCAEIINNQDDQLLDLPFHQVIF